MGGWSLSVSSMQGAAYLRGYEAIWTKLVIIIIILFITRLLVLTSLGANVTVLCRDASKSSESASMHQCGPPEDELLLNGVIDHFQYYAKLSQNTTRPPIVPCQVTHGSGLEGCRYR